MTRRCIICGDLIEPDDLDAEVVALIAGKVPISKRKYGVKCGRCVKCPNKDLAEF